MPAHRRSARIFVVEHGPLHQVVHFWGYDNLADLEMRWAKRDADPSGQSINERLRGSSLAKKTNYATSRLVTNKMKDIEH